MSLCLGDGLGVAVVFQLQEGVSAETVVRQCLPATTSRRSSVPKLLPAKRNSHVDVAKSLSRRLSNIDVEGRLGVVG